MIETVQPTVIRGVNPNRFFVISNVSARATRLTDRIDRSEAASAAKRIPP
jgi:hypothetical protein